MGCVDWNAIKTEYITDESSSYRKLAKKYGISHNIIGAKAVKEGWVEQKKQFQDKTLAKTLNAISNKQSQRATRLQSVTDKLLSKIEQAVDDFEMSALFLDKQALKQITGALKDIKDIQMIRSEQDLREQEARIRNLEKQAESEEKDDKEIRVVIEGNLDNFSK